MECPVCGNVVRSDLIQTHVETCLIDQDAALALQVSYDLNKKKADSQDGKRIEGNHGPQAQEQQWNASHAQSHSSVTLPPSYSSQPNYNPSQPHYNPSPSSQVHQMQPITSKFFQAGPVNAMRAIAPLHPQSIPSQPSTRISGAIPSDVDTYNQKITHTFQYLQHLSMDLQNHANNISKIEKKGKGGATAPVSISELPPPRYMTIKSTNPPPRPNHQPNQGQQGGQVRPPPGLQQPKQGRSTGSHQQRNNDPKHKFYETYQRYHQNTAQAPGASTFFQTGTSTPAASNQPVNDPKRIQKKHDKPKMPTTPSQPPIIKQEASGGITDMHMALIESRWMSNILEYSEDAADLILSHLSMLFSQRVPKELTDETFIEKVDKVEEVAKRIEDGSKGVEEVKSPTSVDNSVDNVSNSVDGPKRVDDGSMNEKNQNDKKNQISSHLTLQDKYSIEKKGDEGIAHPLSDYVASMVVSWKEPYAGMKEPTSITVTQAIQTLQGLLTTLQEVVLDYYPQLSLSSLSGHGNKLTRAAWEAAEVRENLTRQAVSQAVFPLFYPSLMRLIHAKCYAEDSVCNSKLKEYLTIHPAHLGIHQDYRLIELENVDFDGDVDNSRGVNSNRSNDNTSQPSKSLDSHAWNQLSAVNNGNRLITSKSDEKLSQMSGGNNNNEMEGSRPSPGSLAALSGKGRTKTHKKASSLSASSSSQSMYSTPPYYLAIQTLKELPTHKDPDSKLTCVVRSAKALVDAVSSFHTSFGRDAGKYPVGGDELLPIFSYIVLRSGVQNLASEAAFMEYFITDDQSRGEQGYILATLQTVIAFVSCLDSTTISQSVDSVFKRIADDFIPHDLAAIASSLELPAPDIVVIHEVGDINNDAPPAVASPGVDYTTTLVNPPPLAGSFFDDDSSFSTINGPIPSPVNIIPVEHDAVKVVDSSNRGKAEEDEENDFNPRVPTSSHLPDPSISSSLLSSPSLTPSLLS